MMSNSPAIATSMGAMAKVAARPSAARPAPALKSQNPHTTCLHFSDAATECGGKTKSHPTRRHRQNSNKHGKLHMIPVAAIRLMAICKSKNYHRIFVGPNFTYA